MQIIPVESLLAAREKGSSEPNQYTEVCGNLFMCTHSLSHHILCKAVPVESIILPHFMDPKAVPEGDIGDADRKLLKELWSPFTPFPDNRLNQIHRLSQVGFLCSCCVCNTLKMNVLSFPLFMVLLA